MPAPQLDPNDPTVQPDYTVLDSEPIGVTALASTLISQVLVLLVVFGVSLDEAQIVAIEGVAATLVALVTWVVSRRFTTSRKSVTEANREAQLPPV